IESPECGSCEDGIDNNGDGLPDAEDPNCSTLFQLQRYAVIGTAERGLISVKLGRSTQGGENDDAAAQLVATLRAGVCGIDLKQSLDTLVTGAVAMEEISKLSGGFPAARILYQFVNDNAAPAAVITGLAQPLVGPPAKCTDGTTPRQAPPDGPGRHTCGI